MNEQKSEQGNEFDQWANTFRRLSLCMFPQREGPHKVACNQKATHCSLDNYPACAQHQQRIIRDGWRGFVEGA